jgi:hypothetical protein
MFDIQNVKFTFVHATKALGATGGVRISILNFDTRWSVVNARSLYPWERSLGLNWIKGYVGPRIPSEDFSNEICCPFWEPNGGSSRT